jgi:ubiquitin-conjugating enzyme E2 M
VCLNILREDWKPVLDINAVVYGLIYLFYEPNPDDPLNHEAAGMTEARNNACRLLHDGLICWFMYHTDLFRNDIGQFERVVRRTLQVTDPYI